MEKVHQLSSDFRVIQNTLIQLVPQKVSLDSENVVPVSRVLEPFFQAWDKLRCFLCTSVNTDDIQPWKNFIVSFVVYKIILTPFVKCKIQ